jgi:hypothetical protein
VERGCVCAALPRKLSGQHVDWKRVAVFSRIRSAKPVLRLVFDTAVSPTNKRQIPDAFFVPPAQISTAKKSFRKKLSRIFKGLAKTPFWH